MLKLRHKDKKGEKGVKTFIAMAVCVVLGTFSTTLYAEYYLVYPGSSAPCNSCNRVYYKHKPCYRKKHKVLKPRVRHVYHHHYYHCNNGCCGCRAPSICDYRGSPSGRGYCGGYRIQGERYNCPGYYRQCNNCYNPDMATGDDDTWANPGMNIDQ